MWRLRSSSTPPTSGPRSLAALLVVGAALAALPSPAAALTGGNLVVNGDAERPVGAEWTAVSGLGLTSYAFSSVIPANVLIGGGTYAGGTAVLLPRSAGLDPAPVTDPDATVNEQTISFDADDIEAFDSGTVQARFSAVLGGTGTQADRMGAVAEWRDGLGQPIGLTQQLAAVTRAERGDQSGAVVRVDQQPVPAGARSVVVRLVGTREVQPMHNGYADNVELRLFGIPRVEKAFGVASAVADRPFRLTYTVRNSGDREAKPAWSFEDALPEGIRLAADARSTTDCPGARFAVSERRVAISGTVPAGHDVCTAAVDVVAAPGRYTTGPKQLENVKGLRVGSRSTASVVVAPADPEPDVPAPPVDAGPGLPPVEIPPYVPPAPVVVPPVEPVGPWLPPFVRAALRATLEVDDEGPFDDGDRVRLRVRVSNPTTATASRVRACVALPSALRAVTVEERVRGRKARRVARSRSTTRPCWSVGTLAGDRDFTTTLTVRVVRGTGSTVRPRLTVTSPDVVARASSSARMRITKEDADAEGR